MIFWFCFPYGSWEPLDRLKRMSEGMRTFSAIENLILRTSFSDIFRHFPRCQPFSIVAVIISLFPSKFHIFCKSSNRFELPNTLKYGIGVAIASQGQILSPKHWPLLAHPQPGGRRPTGSGGFGGGEAPQWKESGKKKVKKYDRAKLSKCIRQATISIINSKFDTRQYAIDY